jgi:hypothetical protein
MPTLIELAAAPNYDHLVRLGDALGLFEHARYDEPRTEHGYCVDDVARGLVVTVGEPSPTPLTADLTETYLTFVTAALDLEGRSHNRRNQAGAWTDDPTVGDWWGRAVWALGSAAAHAVLPFSRTRAMHGFLKAAKQRSTDTRAMSFAALGAAEVLEAYPDAGSARALLVDAAAAIPVSDDPHWPWPETHLRYANAVVADGLIRGGDATGNRDTVERGLALLEFLLDIETLDGHLSVIGSLGRDPRLSGPTFDQQPIEIAALADACAHAFEATGDPAWLDGIRMAWAWFLGDNDTSTPMYDAATGAGFDGLTPTGRNENRGAESTLAALSTLQQAIRYDQVAR